MNYIEIEMKYFRRIFSSSFRKYILLNKIQLTPTQGMCQLISEARAIWPPHAWIHTLQRRGMLLISLWIVTRLISCQTSIRALLSSWTVLAVLEATECVDSWYPRSARWGSGPEKVLASQLYQCPHPLKIAGALLPHDVGHCRVPGETQDRLHQRRT